MRMIPTAETVAVTSRARIQHLENDVSSLWTAVHSLEAKLGCPPTEASARPQPPAQTENAGDPYDKPTDDDTDSNASDLSHMSPPSHLLQLFDNGLLGSDGYRSMTPSRHGLSQHKTQGSDELRALMPSREDMLTITTRASPWLSLYRAFFPIINLTETSDEMMLQYDKLQAPNADPVAIAILLLSIAITVQQEPDDMAGHAAGNSIRDAESFIRDVSNTVERTVISDDALAGNLEGIETTLLFLRL